MLIPVDELAGFCFSPASAWQDNSRWIYGSGHSQAALICLGKHVGGLPDHCRMLAAKPTSSKNNALVPTFKATDSALAQLLKDSKDNRTESDISVAPSATANGGHRSLLLKRLPRRHQHRKNPTGDLNKDKCTKGASGSNGRTLQCPLVQQWRHRELRRGKVGCRGYNHLLSPLCLQPRPVNAC